MCESEFKLQWGKKFLSDLSKMSFVAVGKKYGVSDNCIRKWITMVDMG